MEQIRLTKEEMDELTERELEKLNKWRREELNMPPTTWLGELNPDTVAQAQIKKLVEWGNVECYDHNGIQRREQGWHIKRRECPICWQALLEEIE